MIKSPLPCVGPNSYRWDLDHADHNRIIGPCLSCSKAVTGCSICPLKTVCAGTPSPGTIRGAIAWLDAPMRGRKFAYECIHCGNPILTRYQKKYCSPSCRKDYQWTYTEAVEQEDRFRHTPIARSA
jgi:hypothetical protein